jgi:opine dehydrogenase
VHLLARSPEKIAALSKQRQMKCFGKLEGEFPLAMVTSDPANAIEQANTIFVATVTTAYPVVARWLAPHLQSGQEVILFSSKFGGVLEFSEILRLSGVAGVTVLETDALFACRTQEDESVWIRGFKNWTLYSGVSRSETIRTNDVMRRYFPGLQPADNVVQRGLTDFGALAHPLTMLANMNRIDLQQPFLFYHEGFTERTIALMETMEKEFQNIAQAYGTTIIPMAELLNRYYGCETTSLLTAMRTVPNYQHSQAPATLKHRYIEEDVACSLVPVSRLARMADLDTPVLNGVIALAAALVGLDLNNSCRSLEHLGWANMTYKEIVRSINA